MPQIIKDSSNGLITISDSFPISSTGSNAAPTFSYSSQEYTISFNELYGVEKFKTFAFDYTGKTDTRYLNAEYRISRDGFKWSDWCNLPSSIVNFPPFNTTDNLHLDLRFIRKGSSNIGVLKLLEYRMIGELERVIETGERTIQLSENNSEVILKPPYIYKVFKIEDLEILYTGDINDVEIKYRYSQDYGRTITDWEFLTKENISSARITPIRFFQIEYLLTYIGNTNTKIHDINLIGDFQNVSLDYKKTNLFGVRENANSLKLNIVGDTENANQFPTGGQSQLLTQQIQTNVLPTLTDDQKTQLFKPYQLTQVNTLLNKLSNDSNEIFGHEVVYFLTDPDKKGTDYTFHEYQLYNYVCESLVKVSVENNQFPENNGSINQFDLSLFDSFEIHIPKEVFKKAFGVEKRPSKEDFLWFAEINRMFTVEHAQPFRSFNNYAIFYKVMLKKYTQKANIIGANQTITDKLKNLTKNSTIDELFGKEKQEDKAAVANKEQFKPLTRDDLRTFIGAPIIKQLIENSENIISRTNYDLSTGMFGATSTSDAVVYRKIKSSYSKSDNISFTCWFNLNNYTINDTYHLSSYFDESVSQGFKIRLTHDEITTSINGVEYPFTLGATSGGAVGIEEETWYGYILNIDQRNRTVDQFLYKRNINNENRGALLNSTELRLVYSKSLPHVPVDMLIENGQFKLQSCDMKITNLRMFTQIIPKNQQSTILNQSIVRDDSKYLVFADNANQRLSLPNYPTGQTKYS
jgi:hypothetical protein